MSTELKSTTEGVELTRFFGGKERGTCVIVTTTYSSDPSGFFKHVTLTREEARTVAQDLMKFAEGNEEEQY